MKYVTKSDVYKIIRVFKEAGIDIFELAQILDIPELRTKEVEQDYLGWAKSHVPINAEDYQSNKERSRGNGGSSTTDADH